MGDLMLLQEPNRWRQSTPSSQDDSDDSIDPKEDLPSDDEIQQVIEYMLTKHVEPLLEAQEEMFSNIKPNDPESVIKAYQCGKKQEKCLENFGAFINSASLKESYA